jgi:propanol-preferring alcohol dehydrogenase
MQTMQAMVLEGPKQPLRQQARPLPEPPAGEVRLRVLACAVCRTGPAHRRRRACAGALPHRARP